MAACTHEDIATIQGTDGTPVTLTFKVQVPEMGVASRTFGETATIKNLTLYVFDESGYYLYPAKAELLNNVTDHENVPADSQTEKTFKVTLTQSSSKRIIHFVANYTPSETLTFDAEQVLITKMSVSGNNDAYWQRMEFEGIDDDTNMSKIPLVRNFAKVTVNVTATNFELINFAVVNKPTSGTVAAYNSSKGNFASYTDASTYSTVNNQGYQGSMPTEVALESTGSNEKPYQFTGTTETPIYMYERKQPSDGTYTYLLVYGTYKYGDETTKDGYYKIDLVDNKANSYNILRNFEYKVTITEVVSAGKDTATKAAAGSANNIVSNTTTQNLLNISDGVSRLYVSFTDTTLVNTDDIKLKYKYIPTVSEGTSSNDGVNISFVSSNGAVSETAAGDVINEYSKASSDDTDGWRVITITPNAPGEVSKHQTIRIQAGALVREVDLHLVQKLTMELSCDPATVAYGIKQSVDVIMTLPTDIPEMYFPLVFKIEAEKLSIYPDSDNDYMPLEVGPSIVPSKNKAQSYYFTKTLEYEDYKNADGTFNTSLVSHFLTNKEASGSTIYVYNEYFGVNETSFEHKEPKYIEVNKTLKITRNASWNNRENVENNLKISSSNSDITIVSYTHSNNGNWSITIRYLENTSGNITFTTNVSSMFGSNTYDGSLTLQEFLNENTKSINLTSN